MRDDGPYPKRGFRNRGLVRIKEWIMKLTMYFVLAAASAFLFVVPMKAQTYGGASSGDLLGYRSSAGHYYKRSSSSKVRKRVLRRIPQKHTRRGLFEVRSI
jgi:hypothetical protein